jgi:hypothetical protein
VASEHGPVSGRLGGGLAPVSGPATYHTENWISHRRPLPGCVAVTVLRLVRSEDRNLLRSELGGRLSSIRPPAPAALEKHGSGFGARRNEAIHQLR